MGCLGFLMFAVQCLIRMFMWPLTVWNVGWGAWWIRWIGKPELFGFVVLKCYTATVCHSMAFPTKYKNSFFKHSNMFHIWDKSTNEFLDLYAMLGLGCAPLLLGHFTFHLRHFHLYGHLHCWCFLQCSLCGTWRIWRIFSGINWEEGFKDDWDTIKSRALKSYTSSRMLFWA